MFTILGNKKSISTITLKSTSTKMASSQRRTQSNCCKHRYTLSFVAIVVCIQIITIVSLSQHQAQAFYIKERNGNVIPQICSSSMPCGWEVYTPNKHVRTPNYFVYSPCKCPDNSKCVRDNEDVSINSYVHRCKYSPDTINEGNS